MTVEEIKAAIAEERSRSMPRPKVILDLLAEVADHLSAGK